jgi:hypothetical protein
MTSTFSLRSWGPTTTWPSRRHADGVAVPLHRTIRRVRLLGRARDLALQNLAGGFQPGPHRGLHDAAAGEIWHADDLSTPPCRSRPRPAGPPRLRRTADSRSLRRRTDGPRRNRGPAGSPMGSRTGPRAPPTRRARPHPALSRLRGDRVKVGLHRIEGRSLHLSVQKLKVELVLLQRVRVHAPNLTERVCVEIGARLIEELRDRATRSESTYCTIEM